MSNNKPYHNYQNYQNRNTNSSIVEEKNTTSSVVDEVEEIEELKASDSIIEEAVEPAVEEEIIETETTRMPSKLIGVVKDCEKLNIREAPNANAQVLCTVKAGSELVIEESYLNDFYKICTEAGLEGYCMKQFIAVK